MQICRYLVYSEADFEVFRLLCRTWPSYLHLPYRARSLSRGFQRRPGIWHLLNSSNLLDLEWPKGHAPVVGLLNAFFAQLCSNWQNFNRQYATSSLSDIWVSRDLASFVCVQFNQTVNFVHQTSNKYIYICKKLQFIHIVNGDGSNQYKPAKMCNYWGPILEMEWSGGSNCVSVPNFEAIAPTVAEIWRYFGFSRWRPPPSWIFQISNF